MLTEFCLSEILKIVWKPWNPHPLRHLITNISYRPPAISNIYIYIAGKSTINAILLNHIYYFHETLWISRHVYIASAHQQGQLWASGETKCSSGRAAEVTSGGWHSRKEPPSCQPPE